LGEESCALASDASSDDIEFGRTVTTWIMLVGVFDLRGSREITCYLIKQPTRHIDVVKIDGMSLSVHARELRLRTRHLSLDQARTS
jgi:hypothetical protein